MLCINPIKLVSNLMLWFLMPLNYQHKNTCTQIHLNALVSNSIPGGPQLCSNPNQTHLIKLFKFSRITRSFSFHAGVIWGWLMLNSAELWPSRNWVWDHCLNGMHLKSISFIYISRYTLETAPHIFCSVWASELNFIIRYIQHIFLLTLHEP